MLRNHFLLLVVSSLFITNAFTKDISAPLNTEIPSKQSQEQVSTMKPQSFSVQQDKQQTQIKYSVKGHPEIIKFKEQQPEMHDKKEQPQVQQDYKQQVQIQHDHNQQFQMQHDNKQEAKIPDHQEQVHVKQDNKHHVQLQHDQKQEAEIPDHQEQVQVKHDQKQVAEIPDHQEQVQVKHDQNQQEVKQHDGRKPEADDLAQQADKTHVDESQSEQYHGTSTSIKQQLPTGRQFHPPPYHQPYQLFQPPSGFEAIRRQFGGGLGSDLVMMGLISLPILGLLTMGSAGLGNLFGLGASSSSSKKSSSKRNKRSLKEKAADAVEYAKNLWNVMEQLERAFEKYDLYQAECRLRVVCEAHHKDRKMGTWGQSILDLMRQQKELEGRELLPVSRFLFSNYAEAAQAGARNENCEQLYTGCPRHLSYYLSAKEDQMENEVENGM